MVKPSKIQSRSRERLIRSLTTRTSLVGQIALVGSGLVLGCSSGVSIISGSSGGSQGVGTGGQGGTGGSTSGGQSSGGGASGGASSGGARSTGGASSSGGAVGSGGGTTGGASSGGDSGAGGSATGGNVGTTGGSNGAGGASGGAGTGGGGNSDIVPSAGCGKTRTLNDGMRSIMSGGQNRTYYLKTPSGYDSSHPYRLIFMFHWFYGSIDAVVNPPDADHNTDEPFYGLGELAGDSSIFVVPQGLSDAGGAGWSNPNNRDVNFTDDMLKAVSNDLCIDTSRVFTTGFSFGGAISYKLACDRADTFRAALVYDTGPVSGNNASDCKKPIAFFQTHGQDDQTFTYSTGLSVLDIFVKTNGCTAATPMQAAQNAHACTSFAGCSDGHPVRFCNFGSGENNPHNSSLKGHYPSPKDPGQSVSWVPGEAWSFIEQF